ncbi:hypothetical protein V2J09_021791 [Rumex salicifolius]
MAFNCGAASLISSPFPLLLPLTTLTLFRPISFAGEGAFDSFQLLLLIRFILSLLMLLLSIPLSIPADVSIDGFLQSLVMEKYHIQFQAEEVDMAALEHMTDEDLKSMGIPMR